MSSTTIVNSPSLTMIGSGVNGMVSSFLTISLCHPLFTAKTRLMSGMRGSQVFFNQPYRGYGINLSCDISNQGVAFLAFNFFSSQIMKNKLLTSNECFVGGVFAGITASPLLSLLERLMILQQVDEGKSTQTSVLTKIKAIAQKEGLLIGTTKGLFPTILRESTNGACFFGLSQIIQPFVRVGVGNSEGALMISYLVAGSLAGFVTTPLDLIKTRMQNEIGVRKTHYSVIKSVGVRHLFTGAVVRSLTISSTMMGLGVFSSALPQVFPELLFRKQ